MNNIWTEINEEVPYYMRKVCEKYNMKCEKLTSLESVLFNKKCCLIIQINRFETDMLYLHKEREKISAFQCGSYLALRYDDDDRKGLINDSRAGNTVRNDLIITATGLVSKCEDVLLGKKDWLEKYKQSSRFSEVRLSPEIVKLLSEKYDFI